jgi:hypothetical protein
MNMKIMSMCLVAMIAACTEAAPPPSPETGRVSEAEALADDSAPTIAVVVPIPELATAARTGDPAVMTAAAANLLSCPSANQCPSQFSACTSWSWWQNCDTECLNIGCNCPPSGCTGNEYRARDHSFRFQVCRDFSGAECQNVQTAVGGMYCGC